jgi:hypothetical protein
VLAAAHHRPWPASRRPGIGQAASGLQLGFGQRQQPAGPRRLQRGAENGTSAAGSVLAAQQGHAQTLALAGISIAQRASASAKGPSARP